MRSKERLLQGSKLCVIIDRELLSESRALSIARAAVAAGADIIQLRCKTLDTLSAVKTAAALRRITLGRAAFIVNDRADVAISASADGLHVGKGDVSVSLAKRLLGRKIFGVSASGLKEAYAAKRSGASYLGVGPIFKTPLKCGKKACGIALLSDIKKLNIPFFAIGGINGENIKKLTSKDFNRVAVIRAVSEAPGPFLAARRLKEALA